MESGNKINLVLVDDHDLFREGLKFLLAQVESMNIVGEAATGKEFLTLLETVETPDVVLLDINMPDMNGIEACKLATQKYSELKIIALTMSDGQEYYFKMIQAGARGFVLKTAGKNTLEQAIKDVMAGGSFFPEDILRKIIFKFGTEDSVENKDNNKSGITRREMEVLSLICQGFTNAEIADKIFLSAKTVEGHRANLLSKTGTKNSAHLVMFAIKNGLIKI
ncbi:MAG: response regulator transcription factor [Bacteroidales bacterium]